MFFRIFGKNIDEMAGYHLPVLRIDAGKLPRAKVKERLDVIDQIMALHEAALLTAGEAGEAGIVEYEMHTGQTKHRVEMADPQVIVGSLERLQRYRNYIASQLSPRRVQLIPISSFKRY